MSTYHRSHSISGRELRKQSSNPPVDQNKSFSENASSKQLYADGLPRKLNIRTKPSKTILPNLNNSYTKTMGDEEDEPPLPLRNKSILKTRGSINQSVTTVVTEPNQPPPDRLKIKNITKYQSNEQTLKDMKEVSAKMNNLYQDSNQLVAKLRTESQTLKGEKEYKKYTDKLLDQLQLIINRLHEIEMTVVQNESEFHQALVRIQGDIRTRNIEVSHQKEKYKDSIVRKDQAILELMTDKRMHEDIAESNKEYYHDIIAQKERIITDLLEEKRNFQVTIRNLNTEVRDVKEQTFNTLQNEVRGQRDNLAGAVNNVAHSYQHILVLTKENNNLKNEIVMLKQKLETSPGEKKPHALEEENKDLKLQLQAANRRIQGLKLEMEEIVLSLKTKKITPDLSGKPENQRVMPLVGSKLTKWPYQDRYTDPEREDFVQNELIRLEKELRRGYDAGIIDNTEYTKEVFHILNKVNELRRKEKLQQKDQLKEVQKMAEEKVDALKNELEKEGSHMDKEVTNFQKEITEWKRENEYLSDMVRRLNGATNELQEELKKLTKEKIKQDNELIQKQVLVTRYERQVQDLASRLAEQRLPSVANVPSKNAVGSQMSIQKSGSGVTPARSRNVSNIGSDPRRKDTTTSNAKPKVVGREFVGFTGDVEYYRRKNEQMMGSTVGSLSSFYEGLLRLDKLDPKIVKKKMNGGIEAILELTRAVPIEEEPEDDYPQQQQQQQRPLPMQQQQQDYGPPYDQQQQQQQQGGYNQQDQYQDQDQDQDQDQQEDNYNDYDEDDEEYDQNNNQNNPQNNQGGNNQKPPSMPQRDMERDEGEQDGFTGKVWGIYNPNQENDQFRTGDEGETNEGIDSRVEDETREPELEVGNAENFTFEEIPDVLPDKYNYNGNLDVVRKDVRLTFQEFAIRWKASDQDDVTRTKLIQMLREQESLKGEALLQGNVKDLLIILKNALASDKLPICQVAARLLSEFVMTDKLQLSEFLQVHPIKAIMKCLTPKVSGEDVETSTGRVAAAFELLNYMADQKMPWTQEMSQLVIQSNGLGTVLRHLQSKNEWQVAQASRIVYYIILNKELIGELRELSGMSLLIINLDSPNRTIRMNVVKGIALMTADIETRERYLAKKDNKLDEVLSKIMQNEPDFIKYLLDILANLIKNNDFANLLLEDADEFEQLLAILEDIDHEDCKNSVYRVFANLAQDIDAQAKIYNLSYKIMIKQLLGNPKPYAKNLLIALNAVIATDSKKQSDQELTQAIMKFLDRPEQTSKVSIVLAVDIMRKYIARHGTQFKHWMVDQNFQQILFQVYLGPFRDHKVMISLNHLFSHFFSDPTLIQKFLGTFIPPVVKSLLDQLRKRDEDLKNSASYNLQYILEDTLTHRFINLPDLRRIVELLIVLSPDERKNEQFNNDPDYTMPTIQVSQAKITSISYTLNILSHLTMREEFMEVFIRMELPKLILYILTIENLPEKVLQDALSVLRNTLSSIYGKNVVHSLYGMKANCGLELLSRMCIPPNDKNEFAKNAAPIWGCLADEIEQESLEILINNSDRVLDNLVSIAEDDDCIGALKAEITQFLSTCLDDQQLNARLQPIMAVKKAEAEKRRREFERIRAAQRQQQLQQQGRFDDQQQYQ